MFDCITCSYADAFPTDDRSTELREDERQKDSAPSEANQKTFESIIIQERDSILAQLQQAKREIKLLRTERKLDRLEIEKLKVEREKVRNLLDGKHPEHRDVLDSVFDW